MFFDNFCELNDAVREASSTGEQAGEHHRPAKKQANIIALQRSRRTSLPCKEAGEHHCPAKKQANIIALQRSRRTSLPCKEAGEHHCPAKKQAREEITAKSFILFCRDKPSDEVRENCTEFAANNR